MIQLRHWSVAFTMSWRTHPFSRGAALTVFQKPDTWVFIGYISLFKAGGLAKTVTGPVTMWWLTFSSLCSCGATWLTLQMEVQCVISRSAQLSHCKLAALLSPATVTLKVTCSNWCIFLMGSLWFPPWTRHSMDWEREISLCCDKPLIFQGFVSAV